MDFCLFLTFERPVELAGAFREALAYTPTRARDPYLDDGAPPPLVVQAYFESLSRLDSFSEENREIPCAAQAFGVRRFPVPDPVLRSQPYCTYLVAYEGPAEDEKAWHAHYLAHHPPLMARLPGIRQLEVYLPIEWHCPPAWRQERYLQRNKVAFDSAEALTAALDSPVRKAMRADYAALPRFSGTVKHYPMSTRRLLS